jgi:hypothetical protein
MRPDRGKRYKRTHILKKGQFKKAVVQQLAVKKGQFKTAVVQQLAVY